MKKIFIILFLIIVATSAGIVFIGVYKNKHAVKQNYDTVLPGNAIVVEKAEMTPPQSELSDVLALFDKYLKMGDVIIFSASDPHFVLPNGIAAEQIKRVSKFSDLYFAIVMKNNADIDIGVTTVFSGLLIADKNKKIWHKWVEIKDSAGLNSNNPYYFWNNEQGEIYLSVVDDSGVRSGEGNLRLFQYLHKEKRWNLKGCYYYTGKCHEPDGEFGCAQKIEEMKEIKNVECQKYLPELVVYN